MVHLPMIKSTLRSCSAPAAAETFDRQQTINNNNNNIVKQENTLVPVDKLCIIVIKGAWPDMNETLSFHQLVDTLANFKLEAVFLVAVHRPLDFANPTMAQAMIND